jgi:hypothetical protein
MNLRSLNRRNMLRGAVAVLPLAAMPVALAGVAQDEDAALFALLARWKEVNAHEKRLATAYYDAEEHFGRILPPMPEALFAREGDAALGLQSFPYQETGRRWYGWQPVEALEGKRCMRSVPYPIDEAMRVAHKYPSDAHTLYRSEPWPEKQARVDEITAAFREWKETQRRAHEQAGDDRAFDAWQEAREESEEVRMALVNAEPKTLAGALAKAAAAAGYYREACELDDEIEAMITRDGPQPEVIALSVVRDLLRLA